METPVSMDIRKRGCWLRREIISAGVGFASFEHEKGLAIQMGPFLKQLDAAGDQTNDEDHGLPQGRWRDFGPSGDR